MNIETWTSDKGGKEVHHFLADARNTYIFGINKELLGDDVYEVMMLMAKNRLAALKLEKFAI